MALSLKDPETDRLARALAALTGESLTTAVRRALADRLECERLRRGKNPNVAAQLVEIGERFSRLPVLDPRTPDEICGYDENGMWT
jgi:antitoxin VapB